MPHKKGHTKIKKSDMMNKKILDKMNPEMIMKYLLKFGLIDPKKDFKYGGSVQKKASVKSVTYKKGGAVKKAPVKSVTYKRGGAVKKK